MKQSILDLLSEITQTLSDIQGSDKQVRTYLAECIDGLLHIETETDDELQDVLHTYLPVFEQLISLLPEDDVDTSYYQSVASMIRGNYQDYLIKTESFYANKSAKTPDWLDWFAANQYIVNILVRLPILGNWDDQIEEKMIRAHQKYAEKYFPKSAFDLYCKFWMSKGSDQHRVKLLRNVLEEDPRWAWAWVEIGDICFNQNKWAQALDAYQHAMEDKRTHCASLFDAAAWAADQIKDLDAATKYFRRCVELDPTFPYAQNNLGWCLNRQKEYAQAEPYLRYALEHDENIKSACRNLFDTMEKLGKTENLFELVQQYPEQFRTKYYRERLGKIGEKSKLVDMEELQKLLQRTTSNEYAGIIAVSPEQSGIRLYEHQKQAVQNLDEWKRTDDSGAGLLVLPNRRWQDIDCLLLVDEKYLRQRWQGFMDCSSP